MAAKAHEAREEKKKGQAVVLAFFLDEFGSRLVIF
jgi:hypothetical protein